MKLSRVVGSITVVGEATVLLTAVVDGVEERDRILDAENVLQIASGEEILRAPCGAAVLGAITNEAPPQTDEAWERADRLAYSSSA